MTEPRIIEPAEARKLAAEACAGPWRVEGNKIVGADVFAVVMAQDEQGGPSWSEDADAALIAAAPDLAHTAAVLGERLARLESAVTETIDVLVESDCTFWACDGPDAPFVSMKTCSNCAQVQQLRAALALGVTE